jgi:hypothetical protein
MRAGRRACHPQTLPSGPVDAWQSWIWAVRFGKLQYRPAQPFCRPAVWLQTCALRRRV